jgi:hypothetical protein
LERYFFFAALGVPTRFGGSFAYYGAEFKEKLLIKKDTFDLAIFLQSHVKG